MGKKSKRGDKKSSNENQIKGQMNQMFNMTEAPLMHFISDFLNKPHNELFYDSIPCFSEPLILLPLDDYKKDICLKFTLKNINKTDNCRIDNITDLIKHERVREGIGFLYYSIKNVYAALLSKGMVDNKPMLQIKMVLDEENWLFYPKFAHELSHRKDFLESSLGQVIKMKQNTNLSPDEINKLNTEFHQLVDDLTALSKEITPEILKLEDDMNASFKDKAKLGIFIEDLHTSLLPSNKNKKNNPTLPTITGNQYEEVA